MSTALRGLTAALGIISVGAAGKAYLSLADEAKNLTAQLKLATAQSGNFGQAQADVKRIADATRNGLAETTDLYATFMRNGRELGITQDQAAKARSEEHTSELQSLMRISYAVFCLKKKKKNKQYSQNNKKIIKHQNRHTNKY